MLYILYNSDAMAHPYLHEVHTAASSTITSASGCSIPYDGKSYRRRARSIEGLRAIATQ
jgi:hypothetical protein